MWRGTPSAASARPLRSGRAPARRVVSVLRNRVPQLAAALLGVAAAACQAGSLRSCDQPAPVSAGRHATLFRFGDVVRAELARAGQPLALVARSGTDLSLLGQRYSHAGFSLRDSAETPWAVRQLYYACDEGRPRIFDQGLAGFLLGSNDADLGYVSLVFLPAEASARLDRTVTDKRQALALLGADYSANAHAWSERYQNCNQWVVEMLATAWSPPAEGSAPRLHAQHWLAQAGYRPTEVDVAAWPLVWVAGMVPWLHNDDHPGEDLARAVYRVSLPDSIERFARLHLPGAQRIELCHAGRRVVVHRGWDPVAEGCVPGPGDESFDLL